MPFRKKKKEIETKEKFTLVLNPLRSELARSRMVERIAQVFPLAVEEASDLVENTPIILLEGLDQETGEQVRNYFTETGAELLLTDDTAYQRRCFRAIWPSPPTFDFLRPVKKESVPVAESSMAGSSERDVQNLFKQASAITNASAKEEVDEAPILQETSVTPSSPTGNETWRTNRLEEIELKTEHALQADKILRLTQEKERLQNLLLDLQKEKGELQAERTRATQLQRDLQQVRDEMTQLQAKKAQIQAGNQALVTQVKELENQLKLTQGNQSTQIKAKQEQLESMQKQLESSEAAHREAQGALEIENSEQKGIVHVQKLQMEEVNEKLAITLDEIKSCESKLSVLERENEVYRAKEGELARLLSLAQEAAEQEKTDVDQWKREFVAQIKQKDEEIGTWRGKTENWSRAHADLNQELQSNRQKYLGEIELLANRQNELQTQNDLRCRRVILTK